MNAQTMRHAEPLHAWQRFMLWLVPTFLLALFAYALPIWFISLLCLAGIAIHEAYKGPGRDWGNT